MNKTDRMLAIILRLQRKGTQRAEDLAAAFETSVRTIYRDMQALCEAGVPVVGAPGQGYSLVEGYFLPPVSFTAEEAVTLLLGLEFVEQQFDEASRAQAGAARAKLEGVLPDRVRRESQRHREGMKLLAGPGSAAGNGAAALALLRGAVLQERTVRFAYAAKDTAMPGGERLTVREADPYGLVYLNSAWMLIAFCRLRQEVRHFRLSRISELTLLETVFEKPEEFDLRLYKPADDRQGEVRLLFRRELANRVRETNYYYIEETQNVEQGLLVTLKVRSPEEILHWVLSWGAGVEVLEPESLRVRLREEIRRMAKRY
ncbi:YafY family transcriptional regulator [Paenibacillus chitinolyticus]|uniref:YafY family transcriptional regulator n=1 Tax=Paenibacillus chitinolyticus TaxID=79263 RepID=A0A410WU29_9BACL|nr:YafY family protein [Paenibacillus chitinolyticus]MCY9591336.1 YafY family transcriptional regulator [Paenibacillus chitinolyticus]MCY9597397.1 YafY family transcriptional regulator [Paenibacillus chitinolyticus]QAV17777.1 YafY family transcriptional regulator [Paenibacillus chitinolyticus]